MIENFRLIITEYLDQILIGIGNTLLLSLVGTVIGFFLALIFANLRILTVDRRDHLVIKILKTLGSKFSKLYVAIFRGTPMIVQAIIFYYTFYSIGIKWSPMQAGLFTVSLNTTAYLTEVIRGAILSLDKGQMEGARSIGLSKTKAMIYIILPQAIKNSMASIGNEFIINIKDTAVLSLIQVFDLFSVMHKAAGAYYLYIESMLIAAMIYLILTLSTSLLLRYLEQKLGAPTKALPSSN